MNYFWPISALCARLQSDVNIFGGATGVAGLAGNTNGV
jgi:hypothetical protein